jgi:hypothetical protein
MHHQMASRLRDQREGAVLRGSTDSGGISPCLFHVLLVLMGSLLLLLLQDIDSNAGGGGGTVRGVEASCDADGTVVLFPGQKYLVKSCAF